ncbi:MAG: ribosome silencing factor [Microthrixaceae bacterium]|nr:ribosome silencing factor [Microthrixaceae bacterium]MCB1012601.1 ribosome silencing factor [Microthrixaceae bacterium]MCB9387465.1 ribosome silencing factor [Microthrixaceae bacterium]
MVGTGAAAATRLAVVAARAADDKLASDIVVLDVADAIGICDHFVLATASNERQVKAIVDGVEERVRLELDERPIADEGRGARRWVVLDYGDVVVHVFHSDERAYYRLDRLYGDCSRTDWTQTG